MKLLNIICGIIILVASCKKDQEEAPSLNLIGTWELRGREGEPAVSLSPADLTPGNGTGYTFSKDSIFAYSKKILTGSAKYKLIKDTCEDCFGPVRLLDRLVLNDENLTNPEFDSPRQWKNFIEIKNDTLYNYNYLLGGWANVTKYVIRK